MSWPGDLFTAAFPILHLLRSFSTLSCQVPPPWGRVFAFCNFLTQPFIVDESCQDDLIKDNIGFLGWTLLGADLRALCTPDKGRHRAIPNSLLLFAIVTHNTCVTFPSSRNPGHRQWSRCPVYWFTDTQRFPRCCQVTQLGILPYLLTLSPLPLIGSGSV